jgi:uncharacterized protein (DUF58 family)
MLSPRGWAVLGCGLFLWIAARMVGSQDLHMVAAGITILPVLAWAFVRWNKLNVSVTRRLSDTKVKAGQRLSVEIEVENRSQISTSFLLLEDEVPASFGRPARMVLPGIHGRGVQRARYSVVCRNRGRYRLGPLSVAGSDPFALARARVTFPDHDEVVVQPEIEELGSSVVAWFGATVAGTSNRRMFRTGEDFYTMREYQEGDDLRRIHWRSVARTGRLMIRQDETARRARGALFLDTRTSALGQSGRPGFERGVSVAATFGALLARSGFSLRLATPDLPAVPLTDERFMETLAAIDHSPRAALDPSLLHLRAVSGADTTLIAVVGVPSPPEIAALSRTGEGFGPKVAVLIYPVDPKTVPAQLQNRMEQQASVARLSLVRAGWEVVLITPIERIADVWRVTRKIPVATASWR